VHPRVVDGGIALALTLRALDKPRALTDPGERSRQLASEMGVSRQTINSIEQDRYTPSLPLALALARFFETTVERGDGAAC
jgi:putative transcriptional regulator